MVRPPSRSSLDIIIGRGRGGRVATPYLPLVVDVDGDMDVVRDVVVVVVMVPPASDVIGRCHRLSSSLSGTASSSGCHTKSAVDHGRGRGQGRRYGCLAIVNVVERPHRSWSRWSGPSSSSSWAAAPSLPLRWPCHHRVVLGRRRETETKKRRLPMADHQDPPSSSRMGPRVRQRETSHTETQSGEGPDNFGCG